MDNDIKASLAFRQAEDAGLTVEPIRRVSGADGGFTLERLEAQGLPVIVSGIIDAWPAFGKWTPSFFAKEFASLEFQPSVNLPKYDNPYDHKWEKFQKRMTISEFVDQIDPEGPPCYVRRQAISKFPSAEHDFRFESLHQSQPEESNTFVWFGCNSLTGLHFDLADGILCQLFGTKQLYLIAPENSRYVYPYRDSLTKSKVNTEEPDLEKFPDFKNVKMLTGTLQPGEFVFLPRRWWHSIRAQGTSVSVSHDYGEKVSAAEIISMLNAGGILVWLSVGMDFVWHGALRRRFSQRLFDDPPFGVLLFKLLTSAIGRGFKSVGVR